MVRIAMIGTDGWALQQIKRLWAIPEKAELVAVSSSPVVKSAGAAICKERGVVVYNTVDILLEKMQGVCDIIFIPTPIHTHADLAEKSLNAGFEVFLEKPPVATIQQLDDLIRHEKKAKRSVAVAFQYLYSSIVQKIKKKICSGALGKVKRIRSLAGWTRLDSYYTRNSWAGMLHVNGDWLLDGTINNPLSHVLANDLYLASAEQYEMADIRTVQAELYHGHDIESEDTSSLRIITSDGVELIFNTTLCPNEDINVDTIIDCEKAVIKYTDFNRAKIVYANGKKEELLDDCQQHIYMLEQMINSFKNQKPYTADLSLCRPFTLTVNAAFESSCGVHGIDNAYIERSYQGDSIKTEIQGINSLLNVAHSQGKLISELGAPWACKTDIFNVYKYDRFPHSNSNFFTGRVIN